ncbi:nuclear transport factor 2 family protein [Streptomyces armeniacus]|uniref:Nuclear transport factor 2 family protein n=1 Tax=Streptomyces armeniacus TaxID=83291 RepID=A0A345XXS0_9ACTN|nr:nuclear transport factor 2 family protein [Streptomyces armeniacus]AXK36436.1 nuclear transport factor 2 family protein [Streptomyces armeniacus]
MDEELREFGRRWAEAERRGDAAALDRLLTEDFHGVGPRGFVIGRDEWLERYSDDWLIHDSFDWRPVQVRRYGDAAVANGVQSQQSTYDGRDVDGHFRVTQLLVHDAYGWRLACIHLSPIAEPPRVDQPEHA